MLFIDVGLAGASSFSAQSGDQVGAPPFGINHNYVDVFFA